MVPLVWQPFFNSYTGLSSRALRLLENPFQDFGAGNPKEWIVPMVWAGFRDALTLPVCWSPLKKMGEVDTLLVTSLIPDHRIAWLDKQLDGPGRKIVIFHDAIPLQDGNMPSFGKRLYENMLALMARFDLVICVSEAAEEQLKAFWSEKKISPALTQALNWPVPFIGQRPSYQAPNFEEKKLLYVSRLKKMKNHVRLLEACEKLWHKKLDFQLELIGSEDVLESSQILNKIRKLQGKGRPVFWRQNVSEEELHRTYRESTFTVFPSLMEGFGLPIVESFWHGRAVICGNGGAIGEVSKGPGTVVADVTDVSSLAEAMELLMTDESRCQTLSEEAYKRPMRSWQDYWQELKPLLTS
ncbi:MAG: glycosyltransferase family 4 protein [Blastochloris sp.]|nr:glycosyltransferase family 4 protein [Blastochloris sp.]